MDMRALALAMACGLAASSGTAANIPSEFYPKAVQRVLTPGVKVVRSFPASSGLTGWVLAQGGRHSVVYTTADNKTLIVGSLVGENGENLSGQFTDKYVPKPDLAVLYQKLEKSSWVPEGTLKDPKSVVYAFVDANCSWCHMTWRAFQPYEKAGLQVRWVMVATLTPTSMPKAIEVMAASEPGEAYARLQTNRGKPWNGETQWSAASHKQLADAISANGELMTAFGMQGTPGVVWKDRDGKVQVRMAMPALSELPAITRLPAQKIDDPALAQFH